MEQKEIQHKLLIGLHIEPQSELKQYMSLTADAVQGHPFDMEFTIKNVGATVFPGGKVANLEIDYAHGVVAVGLERRLEEIKPLRPGEELTLILKNYIAFVPGVAWVRLTLAAKDEKEIQYFKEMRGEPSESYSRFLYVVDPEPLRIVQLLTEIKQQLQKRE